MKRVFPHGKWLSSQQAVTHWRLSMGIRLLMASFVLLTTFALIPTAYAQDNVHVVVRGENLASIASRYGISVQTLINTNGLSNPNFIYTGQRLVIPGSAASTLLRSSPVNPNSQALVA